MQKMRLFRQFVLEKQLFKNSAIWLAESILAYISETRFLPNIGSVQEQSKQKFSLQNKFSEN